MYHYTESGLPYVYLADGYTLEEGPFGETLSIEDADGLHRAIAQWMVENLPTLHGREMRFLRMEMGLTQAAIAERLGVTEQTVSLAERSPEKELPGYTDRLLRIETEAWLDGRKALTAALQQIHAASTKKGTEGRFTHASDGWGPALNLAF